MKGAIEMQSIIIVVIIMQILDTRHTIVLFSASVITVVSGDY